MSKKIANTEKLLNYLSDPDNEFLSRGQLSVDVLGYKQTQTIYKRFTLEELIKIEEEAQEERKRRTARPRAEVYTALLKLAKEGNVIAIKEYLDRTEGKVVTKLEHTGADGGAIEYNDIERAKRIGAILDAARARRTGSTDIDE